MIRTPAIKNNTNSFPEADFFSLSQLAPSPRHFFGFTVVASGYALLTHHLVWSSTARNSFNRKKAAGTHHLFLFYGCSKVLILHSAERPSNRNQRGQLTSSPINWVFFPRKLGSASCVSLTKQEPCTHSRFLAKYEANNKDLFLIPRWVGSQITQKCSMK